jgi:signal transduction histidine kinase/CheY-like chemotaxis protein
MKKQIQLFFSITIGILFFGITFTLIRTFYTHSFPSLRELITPFAMGIIFGGSIGLWRIKTTSCREKLEKTAFELRIANMELRQKNRTLMEAQAKLKQSEKTELIGILAGGVAHDLNNILSGIIAYPEMLLQDLPGESPLVPPLQKIRKSGEKAVAIIQDLLTLGRGSVEQSQVVDLVDVIGQYLASPECDRLRAFHPGVVIETDCRDGLMPVNGSWIHLYKTVMNLVSNAAEAMPDGGTIQIYLETRYVDHPIRNGEQMPAGDYTVLTVSDTGHGIDAQDLQRIFEPFFTKKKMGRSGTGLGMAVVWGTVKDHSGHIEVESAPGEGSCFRIYLPAVPVATEVKQAPAFALENHRGNGQQVLIVDDLEEQRDIIASILKALGYRNAAVSSGEAAVEFLKHGHADIMLLDFFLGSGINGLETYRQAVACRPGIRAISTSGYLEPEILQQLNEMGVTEHLQKPLSVETVAEALGRALNPGEPHLEK